MSDSSAANPMVFRYGQWQNQLILFPFALGLAVFFWCNSKDNRGPGFWVAMAFLGLLGTFGALPGETQINCAERMIERRWKLFGMRTVFRRRTRIDRFRKVCWRKTAGVEKGDWRTWMVGLERISGRPVYLSYFNVIHDGVCEEARAFAMRLSALTGLPLDGEIEAVN